MVPHQHVAGPINECVHCLERTEAVNSAFIRKAEIRGCQQVRPNRSEGALASSPDFSPYRDLQKARMSGGYLSDVVFVPCLHLKQ
jgi:hypothetical protein